jgi:phage shock protein PspC (stress-responsive transcriptional regulator)
MICLDLSYRKVEELAPAFLDETIDHSTVGKAFKRMGIRYVRLLFGLLRKKVRGAVEFDFYFPDATGISTPHIKKCKKAFKTVREREFLKLHAFVGYSRRAGALVAISARVTKPNVPDGTQLGYLLIGFEGSGEPMLADPAYDSEENLKLAMRHGLKPVIKPREIEYRGLLRKQMIREFERNRKLYRQRGVVEAVFAGLANRYDSHTRFKRVRTKVLGMLFMLVAHNLRTLMRVRAGGKWSFCYSMDIRQTQTFRTK